MNMVDLGIEKNAYELLFLMIFRLTLITSKAT